MENLTVRNQKGGISVKVTLMITKVPAHIAETKTKISSAFSFIPREEFTTNL